MGREIYSDNWELLNGERIARWPSKTGKDPRKISVTINSWIGLSPGAKHYYVKVVEKDNMWWCEEKNAWVNVTIDSECGGYKLEASIITEEQAIKLAKYFIKIIMGRLPKSWCNKADSHYVIWSGEGRPKWAG